MKLLQLNRATKIQHKQDRDGTAAVKHGKLQDNKINNTATELTNKRKLVVLQKKFFFKMKS